jgi:hypothetical protein
MRQYSQRMSQVIEQQAQNSVLLPFVVLNASALDAEF